MRSFTAHSDGKRLVPDEPVELPAGSRYRVVPESGEEEDEQGFPLLDLALGLSEAMTGNYPPDLAENHDHYLHGRPKRG